MQLFALKEGSVPVAVSGGTPTTDDVYKVVVSTAGPSGAGEVVITSGLADNVAAAAATSGASIALGTGGGTLVLTFEYLHAGDAWTIRQYATGEIEPASALNSNHPGVLLPVVVNAEGELAVSAELEVGDIEIGAVELKNGATDERASIEAADTARTTATKVLAVQVVDDTGSVLGAGLASGAATEAKQDDTITALGSPAQAGEAAAATAALATESGGNLDTIAADTTSLDGKVTACNTGAVVLAAGTAAIGKLGANSGVDIGDVDVKSSALPTGAATEAKQDDVITALNSPAQAGEAASAAAALAQESGGNLDTIAGDTTSMDAKMVTPMDAPETFAQLTAPGNTDGYDCGSVFLDHVWQVTVAAINTDAGVQPQGSLDGTDWYDMGDEELYDANGTFFITLTDQGAIHVRLKFTSEHGGTDVTIDAAYAGR